MFGKKKVDFSAADLNSVLDACHKKNSAAQKALIKLFWGYARSISMRYCANSEETREIINDSFLKVFHNLHRYDRQQPFKAWLRTIVINTAIDYYRKNQWHQDTLYLDEIELADESEAIITKISAEEILGLVQQLSPVYRMVFMLHAVEGYTHREIADLLGIQEGTSKSNLRDARRKLQHMIRNSYPHLNLIYAIQNNRINEN